MYGGIKNKSLSVHAGRDFKSFVKSLADLSTSNIKSTDSIISQTQKKSSILCEFYKTIGEAVSEIERKFNMGTANTV
jgi:hypothetical protein